MQASVERYDVFRGGRRVLAFAARPGSLVSTALRPPGAGAPRHPFVDARAFDPGSEEELAAILGASASAAEFSALLARAGFEVCRVEEARP